MMRLLFLAIADEKLLGPVHVLTFLGLEIDTDEMMVRIPQSKMNALVAELKKFSKENKITLKDLQSRSVATEKTPTLLRKSQNPP
jgi:hypothetical protein